MDPIMDLCILICLQLVWGELHIRRLLCAQLLLFCATLCLSALKGTQFLRLPVMVLCAAVLTGETRPEQTLQSALCMLLFCAAGAGFCLLGGRLCGFAGVIALGFLLRRRRHPLKQWNIQVELALGGITEAFPALIDTGNRLREPASRDPVLIVQADAAPRLARYISETDPALLRSIPFGVLGSAGEILCFQPDRVDILLPGGRRIEAPPCRAAIFHGRIPGRICALAPPEFADAMARDVTLQGFSDRARRVIHGFFKCKAIHLRPGGADSQGIGVLHRRQ